MSKLVLLSIREFVDRFCSSHRVYQDGGLFYVFRDKPVGDKRHQCQYAIVDNTKDDGSLIWTDCNEASLFADVKPLVDGAFDRIRAPESDGRYSNQGVNSSFKRSA